MKGLRVKCLSCNEIYHETTDNFSPMGALNGTMFVLLSEYGPAGHNWSSFPCESTIMDADLECPGCGSCYSGNIRLVMQSGLSVSVMEYKQILAEEYRSSPEVVEPASDDPVSYEKMSWDEIRQAAKEKRLYKIGMTRKELLELLSEEEAQTQRA